MDRGWGCCREVVTGRKDWRWGGECLAALTHTAPSPAGKRQVNEWVELDMDPDGPRRFGSAK